MTAPRRHSIETEFTAAMARAPSSAREARALPGMKLGSRCVISVIPNSCFVIPLVLVDRGEGNVRDPGLAAGVHGLRDKHRRNIAVAADDRAKCGVRAPGDFFLARRPRDLQRLDHVSRVRVNLVVKDEA